MNPPSRLVVTLCSIVALAVALRIGSVVFVGADRATFGDAADYVAAAQSVCRGNGYPGGGNLPFFRAPGLPLAVAALTGCDTGRLWRAKVGLAIADAILSALLFGIAFVIAADARVALAAGVLAALHPGWIVQVTDLRSEPLFTCCLTASLLALLIAQKRRGARCFALAGLFAALAALTRPVALLAIMFTAIAALFDGRPIRERAISVAAVLLGAMVTLAPWVGYMASRHNELILVNDAGGYNLWRGAHPQIFRALTSRDRATYEALALDFELNVSHAEARGVASVAASPMGRSREWRRRALAMIASSPREATRYFAYKAVMFWRPWLNRLEYSRPVVIASGVFYSCMFATALLGLGVLFRSGRQAETSVLVCWILVFWSAQVPFQVVSRFRTATIDPVLVVLCAVAIVRIATALHGSKGAAAVRRASL